MSNEIKWVIGTGIVAAGLGVGILTAQIQALGTALNTRIDDLNTSLNTRIDDLGTSVNGRIDRLGIRIDGVEQRLRDVEIGLGKIDQRLLTIERVVLPGSDQPED